MLSDLFLPLSSIYSPPIFSLPSLAYLSPNTYPFICSPHSLHQSLSSPTFLASLISPHLPFHLPSTYNSSTYLLPHPPPYPTILHHLHIPLSSSTFLLCTYLFNHTTSSYFLSPLHPFKSPPCSHAPPYSHLSSLTSFPYPLYSFPTSPHSPPHYLPSLAATSPLLSFSHPPPHFLPDLTSPTSPHLHLFILLWSLPLTPRNVRPYILHMCCFSWGQK